MSPFHLLHSSLRLILAAGRRATIAVTLATLLWWTLTANAGWKFGAVAIVGGAVAMMAFPPLGIRWHILGVLRFLGYFFKESCLAGIQVARLAFLPRLSLKPLLRNYPLRLPPGPARDLFVMTISLLPGTLSADVRGDTVIVHVLCITVDGPLEPLEERVAAVFAIAFEPIRPT